MTQEPYASPDRVFWVVDNGSSHRGHRAVDRLAEQFPNAVMVHTPVRASWLNQVDVYFSIIQRKALSPHDFTDLDAIEQCLAGFEVRYSTAAKPPGSSPTIPATSWNDSSDTQKRRPGAAPNRRQPDPRRTYQPDHLARGEPAEGISAGLVL
jgi:hypothetical protein